MELAIVGLYLQAEVIRVVLDNLNTHKIGSLYDAFPSEQAHRISRPLEFHPPKHGSGLNIAEIEWAVLANRRPERMLYETSLRQHVQANIKERNAKAAPVKGRFSTQVARSKLARLYPSVLG